MGQDSAFITESKKLVGGASRWLLDGGTGYSARLPERSNRRRVVVVDAPAFLFQRNTHLPNKSYPRTMEQLYEVICDRVEYYLNDPKVVGVVFMMDKAAPIAKQAKSERRADTNTPKTPMHLLKSISGTRKERGEYAWYEWFCEHPVQADLNSSDSRSSGDNFRIPDKKPNAKEEVTLFLRKNPHSTLAEIFAGVSCARESTVKTALKEAAMFVASDSDGQVRYSVSPASPLTNFTAQEPYWESCLMNKDFKRLVYKMVCKGVARKLNVPARTQPNDVEKFALVLGPDFSTKVKASGRTTPHDIFTIPYLEADICVGYWARYFNKEGFDVQIECIDGDVIIAALLSSNVRIMRAQRTVDTVEFNADTYVVQKRWEPFSPTRIVDINALWGAIQTRFTSLAEIRHFSMPNPVGVYALLSFALGTDYVRKLPQISVNSLVSGLLEHCDEIFDTGPLVTSHCDKEHEISVDKESLRVLVAACYKQRFSLDIDLRNMKTAWQSIVAANSRPVRSGFSEAFFNVFHAQLTWCLRYYNRATYNQSPPDAFEKNADGTSVYGFRLLKRDCDEYGGYSVDFPPDARCEPTK